MSTGARTLGEIAGQIAMLEVACAKCDRKGRYRLSRLIAEQGADRGIPDWLETLRRSCPRHQGGGVHDRCGAHCPQLLDLP
jgi:hypothetical protein